jgi:hypothetical protein
MVSGDAFPLATAAVKPKGPSLGVGSPQWRQQRGANVGLSSYGGGRKFTQDSVLNQLRNEIECHH